MPRAKGKEQLIPPLNFVKVLPTKKIPMNADFIQCTARYPRVQTIPAEDKHTWIEPHFDDSAKCLTAVPAFAPVGRSRPNKQTRSRHSNVGTLEFSSCGQALKVVTPDKKQEPKHCPIVPPKTPTKNICDGDVLVNETVCDN